MGHDAAVTKQMVLDKVKLAVTRANECIVQTQSVTDAQMLLREELAEVIRALERRVVSMEAVACLWATLPMYWRVWWAITGRLPDRYWSAVAGVQTSARA